jgi:hypothetical protein
LALSVTVERMQAVIWLIQVLQASGCMQCGQHASQTGCVLGVDSTCRSCHEKLLKALMAKALYHL